MTTREKLMDTASELYERLSMMDKTDLADRILDNNGASQDDSDPDEGFFITMSNDQISSAIDELKKVLRDLRSNSEDEYDVILTGSEFDLLMESLDLMKSKHPDLADDISDIITKFM